MNGYHKVENRKELLTSVDQTTCQSPAAHNFKVLGPAEGGILVIVNMDSGDAKIELSNNNCKEQREADAMDLEVVKLEQGVDLEVESAIVESCFSDDESPIQIFEKCTGELKELLRNDQRSCREKRSRSNDVLLDMEGLSDSSVIMLKHHPGTENEASIDDQNVESALGSEIDFPTIDQLAEDYSHQLIEKERSLLEKDAKIMELEKTLRNMKVSLEACGKELRDQSKSATKGFNKLTNELNEKRTLLLETSEKLRMTSESYNLSNKAWAEREILLEEQVRKNKEKYDSAQTELKRITEEKNREIESLCASGKNMKKDLLKVKDSLSEYGKLLEVAQAEKLAFAEELDSLRLETKETTRGLEESLRLKQAEVDESHSKLEEVNIALVEQSGTLAQREKMIADLRAEIEQFAEESRLNITLQDELDHKAVESEDLKGKLKNLEEAIQQFQFSAGVSEQKMEQMNIQVVALSAALDSVQTEKDAGISEMEEEVNSLKERCAQYEEKLKKAFKAIKLKNDRILALEKNEEEADSRHELVEVNLRSELAQLQTKMGALSVESSNDIATLQERCSELTLRLERDKQERDAFVAELISERDNAFIEISRLREEIKKLETSKEALFVKLNAVNTGSLARAETIEQWKTEVAERDFKIATFTASSAEAETRMSQLQADLEKAHQDVMTYYNGWCNSKQQEDFLRQTCENNNQTISLLNSDITEARNESELLSTQLQNLKTELSPHEKTEELLAKVTQDLKSSQATLLKEREEFEALKKVSDAQATNLLNLEAALQLVREEDARNKERVGELEEKLLYSENQRLQFEQTSSQYANELLGELEAKSRETTELRLHLEDKTNELNNVRVELEEGIAAEKSFNALVEDKNNEIRRLTAAVFERDEHIQNLLQQSQTRISNLELEQEIEALELENGTLEQKVELLQRKLEEVEASEVKCFEDISKLKVLRTELEMDNLRMSGQLEHLRDGGRRAEDSGKVKLLEGQLMLLTQTLDARDAQCANLMKKMKELQELSDSLLAHVNEVNPPSMPSGVNVQALMGGKERQLLSLKIDLERERKIREMYEAQLLLSASTRKQFDDTPKKKTGGGWFGGLSEFFESPRQPAAISPLRSVFSKTSATLVPTSAVANNQSASPPSLSSSPQELTTVIVEPSAKASLPPAYTLNAVTHPLEEVNLDVECSQFN